MNEARATGTRLRVFCAVPISDEARSRAARHITQLRTMAERRGARAAWERPEKMHITLKFFAELEATRLPVLTHAVEAVATSESEFPLALSGAGFFPPRGSPRVLWLGIADPAGALETLWKRLENECSAVGFERETRRFHPHLTIARLRDHVGARFLATKHRALGFEPVEFAATTVRIIRSELSREGARHEVLSVHPLTRASLASPESET